MKYITTSCKSLSDERILAWNKLSLSQETRSILGTKAKIFGLNLFQRLNFWIVKLGGQLMVMPPTLSGVETLSTATLVCAVFTSKLDEPIADNCGIYLVTQASENNEGGDESASG